MPNHPYDPQHDHQDPRAAGASAAHGREHPSFVQGNHGAFKQKAVARNDPVVNWFRRGEGR